MQKFIPGASTNQWVNCLNSSLFEKDICHLGNTKQTDTSAGNCIMDHIRRNVPEEGQMKLPCLSAVIWRQRGDLTEDYNSLKYCCKGNGNKQLSGVGDDLRKGKSQVLILGGSPWTSGLLQEDSSVTLESTSGWKVCPHCSQRVSRIG